jgi:RNA polymerase sigma-70 factor (ECF subfamily)
MTDSIQTSIIVSAYLANRHKLERFLSTRFSHDVEAEDAIQELWTRIAGMDDSEIDDPLAYLFKMANNLAIDRKRTVQMRIKRERAWVETRIDRVANDTVDSAPNAERILLSRERLDAVDAILNRLPERTSRIFKQFRVDGIPQKIIAYEEDISLSAVEKHLMRAYQAILKLKSDGEDR